MRQRISQGARDVFVVRANDAALDACIPIEPGAIDGWKPLDRKTRVPRDKPRQTLQ